MQLALFTTINYFQLTEEMFLVYFDCRKNKHNTQNALRFEKYLEKYVLELIDKIYKGKYQLGRGIAFILNKPVA
jgi:RNA-directed DNA polymerase